jgi:flagellar basal body rod protein FlgG
MADGIYVALSGAVAQELALESTAQNLANAGTHGYQRVRPVFHEFLAQAKAGQAKAGQAQAGPGGPQRFAASAGTRLDTSAGAIRATGNALDLALPKGTYLAVLTERGERYTRAGSLKVGTDGTLQTQTGTRVSGEDGKPIKVSGEGVAITDAGEVRGGGATAGRLRLVTFPRIDALSHEGGTLLAATPESGAATVSKEAISVGALEESNANVVHAMTDLVAATRTFEAFQRAIETFRDLDRRIVTTVPDVK